MENTLCHTGTVPDGKHTLCANVLAADDRFIAPDGSDSNDGLSRKTAFRTLGTDCRATPSGKHTIRVAAGEYEEEQSCVLAPGVSLVNRLKAAFGETGWRLEVDPEMSDGQCLLFHYQSVFPVGAAGYVRPVVKIELGARSDDWPHENKTIQPYVTEHFPAFDPDAAFPLRVLAAERTFWEKACLLHEETFRPADKPRNLRMARHYYDLWCLLRAGVGERALANKALVQRVAEQWQHQRLTRRVGFPA